MKNTVLLLAFLVLGSDMVMARAKNVILFLGDAGGISTLHLASVYRYNHSQKLFIQQMPHLALMDTSAADTWVTDSAAGMTALVTGQKTNNGIISQSASAQRGKKDGEILKTILEYAEDRGLSTGVVSNMNVTDATLAACYAHANDRSDSGRIFAQIFSPRFGDGVDVVIGAGRERVLASASQAGLDVNAATRDKKFAYYDSLYSVSGKESRVLTLLENRDFDVWQAIDRSVQILSRNRKGYFLMVEWDIHTDNLKRGLDQSVQLDDAIRRTTGRVGKDTLIIFAADHSFATRLLRGKKGEPILPPDFDQNDAAAKAKANIRIGEGHSGEQVLVAAQGPGAERVRGFIDNTDLFRIMMSAYGWKPQPAGSKGR